MTAMKRIVYVDDEPDIREIVALALGLLEGVRVHTCASGREALDQLPQLAPDMVLLDVMMPGLDGPATLAALRELEGFRETPVVFVTAKAMPCEVDRFKMLGAAGVIAKPFDPMQLATQVEAIWIAHRRVSEAVRTKIETTRRRFLERSEGELARIGSLVGAGTASPEALGEMRGLSHRIHGSAAIFGFSSLSETAGRLERLLETSLSGSPLPSATLLAQLRALHSELASALRVALPDPA